MEPRVINANDLLKSIQYDMGYKQGKVDAVVHGRWLERGSPWNTMENPWNTMWLGRGSPRTTLWNCSVCGNSPHISSQQTDYCHHCGAEME